MEHRRPLASKRGTGISFAQYNAARGGATAPTRASRRAATAAAAAAATAAAATAAQPVAEPALAHAPEPIAEAVIPPAAGGASDGIPAATATAVDTKPVPPQALAAQEGAPVVAVDWADPVVLAPVAPAATPGEDLAAEVRSIFDGNFAGAPGVGSTLGGGDFFGVAPTEAAEAQPAAVVQPVVDEKAQESGDDDDELITALASRSRKRRREAKKSDGGSEWVPPVVNGEDGENEGEKDEEVKAGGSKRLKAETKADRVIVKPRGKAMQKAVEQMDVDAVLGKDLDGYSKNAEYHQRLARVKASYEKARKEREDKRAKSGTQQRVYGKKKRTVVQAAMRKEAEERKAQLALDKSAAAGQAEAHQASELAAAAAFAANAATAAAAAAAAASAAADAAAGPVPQPSEAAGHLPSGEDLNADL